MSQTKWRVLMGADGKPYKSAIAGAFGGHRKNKLYGVLNCRAALQHIAKGGYVKNRVFFLDEATAISAGYRPCAVCMSEEYGIWRREKTSKLL